MRSGFPILLLLFISACASQQSQARCEPFEGEPPNSNTTQAAIAANVTQALVYVPFVMKPECSVPLVPFTCIVSFIPCDNSSDEARPAAICPDLCDETVTGCTGTLVESVLPDCAVALGPSGALLFETARMTEPCYAVPEVVFNGSCPPLFVAHKGSCQLRCPFPPWEQDYQYRRMDLVNWIITPLSLLCEVAFIVPWAYQGIKARNLHKRYPFWFALSCFFISLNMAMTWGGLSKWQCHDEVTEANQRNEPKFIVQALFGTAFGIANNCWVACLMLHLCIRILTQDRGLFGSKGTIFGIPEWVCYHTFTWTIAFSLWIIGLAMHAWQPALAAVPVPDLLPNKWRPIGLTVLPPLILSTCGATLFAICLFQKAKWIGLRSQIRLCLLCVWYIFFTVYASVIFLRLTANQDRIIQHSIDYITCKQSYGDNCELNAGVLYATLGLVLFAIFWTAELVKIWKQIFKNLTGFGVSGLSGSGRGRGSSERHSTEKSTE